MRVPVSRPIGWPALALALALVGVLSVPAGRPAAAAPDDGSRQAAQARRVAVRVAQEQSDLDALSERVSVAVEDYDVARIALAASRRTAALAAARVSLAQQALVAVRASLGDVAAQTYRTGSGGALTSGLAALVLSTDARGFLERTDTLSELGSRQAQSLLRVSVARHRLADEQARADAVARAAQLVATRLLAAEGVVQHLVASQRLLLGSLRDEQRRLELLARTKQAQAMAAARRAAAQQADRQRALAAAAAAGRVARRAARAGAAYALAEARADRGPAPAARPPRDVGAVVTGSAAGRGRAAVQAAAAQLGDPYEWAAAGPSRFDCSGLTLWAWAAAGVSLPHSSRAQYAGGRKVARGDLRAGDLIFYGAPIHHVGLYVGGGQMINAPHTGDVVRYASIDRRGYVGAVRPG